MFTRKKIANKATAAEIAIATKKNYANLVADVNLVKFDKLADRRPKQVQSLAKNEARAPNPELSKIKAHKVIHDLPEQHKSKWEKGAA